MKCFEILLECTYLNTTQYMGHETGLYETIDAHNILRYARCHTNKITPKVFTQIMKITKCAKSASIN